ncbi:MAG: helix-hairpin-helix domain-containing protein [Bacteroidaceae bacterium]|nr:helix-hairpin-helix domain-containing protein [Bacteroidaceae bacterium]
MWKEFFYFSRNDKIAIGILSTIIVVSLVILCFRTQRSSLTDDLSGKQPTDSSALLFRSEAQTPVSYRRDTSQRSYHSEGTTAPNRLIIVPEPFDPNTADSSQLIRMGLSPRIASNLLRYRRKGGVFRTPESLSRIYGLPEDVYKQLLPYIRIGEQFTKRPMKSPLPQRPTFVKKDSTYKYPEGTRLDLNSADTTELKKIPGIGSYLARKIVSMRLRLGGFCSVEQLQEVSPHLTPDMHRWFIIETPHTPGIFINKEGVDRLRDHPYLNFYQARIIVEHRKKHGAIKSLQELTLYPEFTPEDLDRLKPYVSF